MRFYKDLQIHLKRCIIKYKNKIRQILQQSFYKIKKRLAYEKKNTIEYNFYFNNNVCNSFKLRKNKSKRTK